MTKKNDAESTAPDVARSFLAALGRRDFDDIERHLATDVWFRALLPRGLEEARSASETREKLSSWFSGAEPFRVLENDHHSLEGREHLRYRFLLRPEWAPEQWHVIEQVGFCRVKEGVISRLDLVCTGFFPTEAPMSVEAA